MEPFGEYRRGYMKLCVRLEHQNRDDDTCCNVFSFLLSLIFSHFHNKYIHILYYSSGSLDYFCMKKISHHNFLLTCFCLLQHCWVPPPPRTHTPPPPFFNQSIFSCGKSSSANIKSRRSNIH